MKRGVVLIVLSALATSAFAQTAVQVLTDQISARSNPLQAASFVPEALRNQPPIPFFKNHVVVFFFASTCPYCKSQAPVLSRWASTYGVRVDARSFDDKAIPDFEGQRPVTKDLVEAAFAGKPITYPALFVMNETRGTLYPVSFGALNEVELQARMDSLIPRIMQHEEGYAS
jgi:type-F conjugative transfer system pilin assembly thiol-disulfide isomerase TrbB